MTHGIKYGTKLDALTWLPWAWNLSLSVCQHSTYEPHQSRQLERAQSRESLKEAQVLLGVVQENRTRGTACTQPRGTRGRRCPFAAGGPPTLGAS